MCALNHYCAITRVDYREYKECFKTAASALASTSTRPMMMMLGNSNIHRQRSATTTRSNFNFITNLLIFIIIQQFAANICSVLLYQQQQQRNILLLALTQIITSSLTCTFEFCVKCIPKSIGGGDWKPAVATRKTEICIQDCKIR